MTPKSIFKTIKAYLFITLGSLVYCLAWTQIFMPNGIASGGVTGLCTVIEYGTGFPMAWSYGIFNVFLLMVGFAVLGKSFGIRTVYALLVITLFLDLLPQLNLPVLQLKDAFLNPVIASFCEAIGISVLIHYGGSSGGTDIIALIVNKFWTVTLGKVYMILDIIIIASIMLVPGKSVDDMVYGYLAVIVFSLSLDFIMLGRKSSVQILVFSEHYAAIADYINKEMDRGVTVLNATGWYSQQERNILLILVRRAEMSRITDKIKEVDPKAFVAVTPVSGVYGEGFEQIKNGLKRKKKALTQDGQK